MTKPVLHGVNPSPFVRKVRIALVEKGVDYDQVPVMPGMAPPEYKEISPLAKVPCYTEGDFSLPDSSAIIAYLDRVHPTPSLYPEDPKEFGRALWYEEYADSKLADNVGGVFFNRVVKVKMMKQEPDQEQIDQSLAALPEFYDYLEASIDDREVLCGSEFSVADIAVGSQFVNLAHAGEAPDPARWPRLAAYIERLHARPSFKAAIEEEKAFFANA